MNDRFRKIKRYFKGELLSQLTASMTNRVEVISHQVSGAVQLKNAPVPALLKFTEASAKSDLLMKHHKHLSFQCFIF